MLIKGSILYFNILSGLICTCVWAILALAPFANALASGHKLVRVLNFYGSCGFNHDSQSAGLQMVEHICRKNKWEVVTTDDAAIFNAGKLSGFNLVIFNNNCGNSGRIFSDAQQSAFQQYIRSGGGFVGIHCAGAIWNEGAGFQKWYERLAGARLIEHPAVQEANCLVENLNHPVTKHLPGVWKLKDEFHTMYLNPRNQVDVLISVDEASYNGKEKMHGDHPIVWTNQFDGGKSFFCSLGHTKEIYADENYIKLIEGGMKWSIGIVRENGFTKKVNEKGLIVDLNADRGVITDDRGRVEMWLNQVEDFKVKAFVKRDKGRKTEGSGRPLLTKNLASLNGHNTLLFEKQELVAEDEDAFDHLITGSGYTWFCVLKAGKQSGELKDVNSFFGTLKNGGFYEGVWGGLNDDNSVWTGARNGKSFGRWDANNPYVRGMSVLDTTNYYLLIGCMDKGTDTVNISLFINKLHKPAAVQPFPVNINANASKLAIGQERDATEHPGRESFIGEISRFLLYDRPMSASELRKQANELIKMYQIKTHK